MRNKIVLHMLAALTLTLALAVAAPVQAASDTAVARVGVSGYDVVAYHAQGKAMRGSGYKTVAHKGITYLFSSDENKAAFEKNPERYLPAYGGYCAYGVSAGKKFYASPEVWKVVDGVLYLNLDEEIQKMWNEDVPGHIQNADKNWKKIRNTAPEKL